MTSAVSALAAACTHRSGFGERIFTVYALYIRKWSTVLQHRTMVSTCWTHWVILGHWHLLNLYVFSQWKLRSPHEKLTRFPCHPWLAPGNPTLWRGVPVASIQKSFGSSGRDWKQWKKLPIPCKFCTYRFIGYSSTCYGKVRINPLMANTRNPDFFASPVANAVWFVVVRPCYLNRDLLSGPKGN